MGGMMPLNFGEELDIEERKSNSTPSPKEAWKKGRTDHFLTKLDNEGTNRKTNEVEDALMRRQTKKQSMDVCSEEESIFLELKKIESEFTYDKVPREQSSNPNPKKLPRICSRKYLVKDKKKTNTIVSENKPEKLEIVQLKEITPQNPPNNKLFDYDFDGLRAFRHYFFEGNYRNVLKCFAQFKQRNSPRKFSPPVSFRKRPLSPMLRFDMKKKPAF